MTSIAGPHTTGRLAGRAQLPIATPAQIEQSGALAHRPHGALGHPFVRSTFSEPEAISRRCNGGALADLVDDMNGPRLTKRTELGENGDRDGDSAIPIFLQNGGFRQSGLVVHQVGEGSAVAPTRDSLGLREGTSHDRMSKSSVWPMCQSAGRNLSWDPGCISCWETASRVRS